MSYSNKNENKAVSPQESNCGKMQVKLRHFFMSRMDIGFLEADSISDEVCELFAQGQSAAL